MILFRALNNLDVLANPIENGIASKQMIYNVVKNYYEKNNISEYHSLNEEEKDLFIKEHMEEYIKNHNSKLKNKYYKSSNKSREDISEFCKLQRTIKSKSKEEIEEIMKNNKEKINFGSYIELSKYLSTLQKHLLYGSSKITDWVSFSTSMGPLMRYYNNQDIHKVAVIKSDTGGLVDSNNILSVDLSTYEKIKEKNCLINNININQDIIDILSELSVISPSIAANFNLKLVNKTDINSRGFKYANNSKEVCIYKYVPKDYIVAILESLQVDLMRIKSFNTDFFKLSLEEQKKELEILKRSLEYNIINLNDPFVFKVFNDLYIDNKNINSIINFQDSEERVIRARNKILGLAINIPNKNIKR